MNPLYPKHREVVGSDEFITSIEGFDIYWDPDGGYCVAIGSEDFEVYTSGMGGQLIPDAVENFMVSYESLRS